MEIGGYFELQLPVKEPYYPDLIPLNSGRSCLEYILRAGSFTKIYLPWYICEVLLEPVHKLGIKTDLYTINDDFTIKDSILLKETEILLYVNYFGLMDEYISTLSGKYGKLIIDNAQSFFSKPLPNVITYYSPRKFFGVPDGGYLSTDRYLGYKLEQDVSYDRLKHLIIRSCESAESGYKTFKENERLLSYQPLKEMSKITSRILQSIDYGYVKKIRESNFIHLHQHLKHLNKLFIPSVLVPGPMAYPLYLERKGIKEFLIENKIFVPTFWPDVLKSCPENSTEYSLASNIVALPVDQRYNINDMEYILHILERFLKLSK